MPNPHDPNSSFDPRSGSKIDPRDPFGTPGSPRALNPYAPAASFGSGGGGPPTSHGPLSDVEGRDTPDPGSPGARTLAWVVAIVLFTITFFLAQCEHVAPGGPTSVAEAPDPDSEQSVVMTSMFIKLGRAFEGMQPGSSEPLMQQVDAAVGAAPDPLTEQVRAAIAAAELAGAEDALSRLDTAEKRVNDERVSAADPLAPEKADALIGDIELLRAIYHGNIDGLTQTERDELVAHHGRLGRIALSYGKPASDPDRAALVEGGEVMMGILFAFGALLVLLIPASLTCFIIAIIRFTKPGAKAAFVPPTPGGSVYIEMLAIFLIAFLLVQVAMAGVGAAMGPNADEGTLTTIGLLAQWPVALVAFWPLVRGVSLREHARRIGWTRGKGVLREIFAGIFAYLAGVPLLVGAFIITIIAVLIQAAIEKAAGGEGAPPANPILDIATSGGLAPILLFLLATIWAPFTEEAIFRGALFRHLRSRRGLLLSAVVSALFFGLIHGYAFFMLLPVITLGFNFALMREWRGSLIAPITAHALHNATIMGLVLGIMSQIG